MKKTLYFNLHTIFLLLFVILMSIIYGTYIKDINSLYIKITYLTLMILSYLLLLLYGYTKYIYYRKQIYQIQNVFDFYSTKLMGDSGIGIIIFNKNKRIIWLSSLVEDRFPNQLIGKDIYELYSGLSRPIANAGDNDIIEKDNLYYKIKVSHLKNVILITDITKNYLENEYYENAKLVLGFADIDSYNQYQTILEEETLFKVDISVTKILDNLALKFGVVYKKYGPGKFLLITNNFAMKKMQDEEFKFIDVLRKYSKSIDVNVSLSFGFGTGSTNYSQIESNARAALSQSHSRGGDQVTIVSSIKDNQYYGAKSEISHEVSRVEIKRVTSQLWSLLKEDTINRVIITGHIDADLDAIGSALGLVAVVNFLDKEVYIANDTFDSTTKTAIDKWVKDYPLLFIKPSKAKRLITNKTIVIIVDTSNESRIEAIEAVKEAAKDNIFIFDHHRANIKPSFEYQEQNSYIDTSSSSTCEIITELINFIPEKIKIPQEIAQFMLAGIYLDTNNFQKTTTYRTYDAASWLEKQGGVAQNAVDILKPDEKEAKIILEIKKNVEEIKPGFVLSVYDGELNSHIIAAGANELLRTANRYASFVIAKVPGKNSYSMSARSINVNVQRISELVGGGGHFSAAAAMTNEPLKVFKDNIIQAIVSTGPNENNSN